MMKIITRKTTTSSKAILDRLGNHTTTENLSTSQPTLGQNETTSGNETMTTIVPNGTITKTLPNGATPYDSGYSHGCSDARSERYINQPGKGTTSHTFSFMQGYYNGIMLIPRAVHQHNSHQVHSTTAANDKRVMEIQCWILTGSNTDLRTITERVNDELLIFHV